MASAVTKLLALAFCAFAMTAASQDNVLRFVSHEESIRHMEKFQAKKTVCPNGITQCSDSSTCCPLQNGQFGCCDGVNAVCCKDGVHCCPQGYTCDEQHGQCTSATLGLSFHWVDKNVLRPQLMANNTCPNNKTVCRQNDTCCNATTGYGCCPLPHAVCCLDKLHCCPQNTKCDIAHKRCYSQVNNWKSSWIEKQPASVKLIPFVNNSPMKIGRIKVDAVICEDGSMCPDGYTCCPLGNGSYACCPYSDAVCCSDYLHCCPHGYTCDLIHQTCNATSGVHMWSKLIRRRGKATQFRAKKTVCPNGITQCSDSSTCCPLQNGQFGCCDGVNAVCCKDGVHCCPQGYTCDEQHGQCTSAALGLSFHWVDKNVLRPQLMANNTCPNNKTVCRQNDTCCNATTGYGCCPLPHAVCCLDKLHCCPQNTKCDIAHKRCYSQVNNWVSSWIEKQPASVKLIPFVNNSPMKIGRIKDDAVICDDGSMCPDGDTCCPLGNGSYGCCPLPDAVCCSDYLHCCPHGETCDLTHQTCDAIWGVHMWSKLIRRRGKATQAKQDVITGKVNDVICPGGKEKCPDGSTCCQLASGEWGCCPRVNAVCCSDHIHCCPQNYTCDVQAGQCKPPSGGVSLPFDTKKPAVLREVETVVCPDRKSQCASGQTCCKTSSGSYGCCPYSEAECCSDLESCCPHGYKCVEAKCVGGPFQFPARPKLLASPRVSVESIVCPGGESDCPDGQTCCPMSEGGYGCCPLPKAVCCSDKIHCCPNGYTCDIEEQTCNKGDLSIPMVEKQAAKPRENSVICPDKKSQCPDGQTCCKLSGGQYGCCPIPKAVCCSDHVHCCPHGYTCDPSQGRCNKGQHSVLWEMKQPAQPRVSVESIVCPGGESDCPDGQTCCPMSEGGYGCCPLPKAVCCSDKIHCCPNGYTCDIEEQTCNKGDLSIPMVEKQAAKPRENSVICPDKTSQCPDGQTCCKLSGGQYGCCPIPKAVCCSDHVHCCPHGYTCDPSQGRCNKGQHSVLWEMKQPAQPRTDEVVCPDHKFLCPDGQTCCLMAGDQYGCCPRPDAVCCSDHIHCCPHGYTCDVQHSRCLNGLHSIPWEKKQQAKKTLH